MEPTTPLAPVVRIVDVCAPSVVEELRRTIGATGAPVADPSRRHPADARNGDLLVLIVPGTFGPAPLLGDLLNDLDRVAAMGRALRLVVVWCVDEGERFRMAAPHRTAAGYDPESPPGGWNASSLFTANAWPRQLRLHGGDVAAAVRAQDQALRRLFSADSHHRIGGAEMELALRVLTQLDRGHLHAVVVGLGSPTRWYGAASVLAAIEIRVRDPSPLARTPGGSSPQLMIRGRPPTAESLR